MLDDCSTDRSPEIIAEIAASSPRPDPLCPRRGEFRQCVQAMAKGLALARGDYIWIAGADDLAMPDFLSTVMRGFRRPACCPYCRSAQIDGADNPWRPITAITQWRCRRGNGTGTTSSRAHRNRAQALFLKNTILNASAVVAPMRCAGLCPPSRGNRGAALCRRLGGLSEPAGAGRHRLFGAVEEPAPPPPVQRHHLEFQRAATGRDHRDAAQGARDDRCGCQA